MWSCRYPILTLVPDAFREVLNLFRKPGKGPDIYLGRCLDVSVLRFLPLSSILFSVVNDILCKSLLRTEISILDAQARL